MSKYDQIDDKGAKDGSKDGVEEFTMKKQWQLCRTNYKVHDKSNHPTCYDQAATAWRPPSAWWLCPERELFEISYANLQHLTGSCTHFESRMDIKILPCVGKDV